MLREDEAGPGADPAKEEAKAPPGQPNDKPEPSGKPSPQPEQPRDDASAGGTDQSKVDAAKAWIGRHPIASATTALVVVAALVAAILWYLNARHFETTDDAFVDSRSFTLAPKVSGYVTDVLVTDNQHVPAGTRIALIDQRDYLVALDQAKAQLSSGQANLQSAEAQIGSQQAQVEEARAQVKQSEASFAFANDEARRASELVQRGAGTVQRSQQTTSQQGEAEATLARSKAALVAAERQVAVLVAQRSAAGAAFDQAKAQVGQAELNLSYTVVTAAQSGRVVRLTGAKGQLAQAGTALAMFVPDELWVTANFKETQLTDMRPGQPVEMTIDAYPDRKLTGKVASVQPGSGTVFSLLPAQNATGNYVKVVQRVPVKLTFDGLPDDVTIGPGMSVVPSVRVR